MFGMAAGQFFHAVGFMRRHRLLWLFVFPLILNVLLWAIGAHYTSQLSVMVSDAIRSWLPDFAEWPQWLISLMVAVGWILRLLLRLILFLALAFLSGYVVLIILSPVFSLAAVKVMEKAGVESDTFSVWHFFRDLLRGILLSFRNLLMELFLSIMFLIGGMIPVAGFFAPLALFLTSSYYFGFSFIDYSLEQKGYSLARSVWFVKQHRGLAIGCGLMFTLTMMIPYVGIFLAGFTGIVSVVAATLAVIQVMDNPKLSA
jgi:CysZ protein